eukprot:gene11257-11406_t
MGQGIALAIAAAVCNGSFAAFAKTNRVRKAQVPSHIFNIWMCVGVLLAAAPVGFGSHFRCLSWQGLLSGLLFVLSAAAAIQAVQSVGMSQANGIWCGTAALVSFAFGAAVEHGSISSWPLAAAGMSCVIMGIALVALAGQLQLAITSAQQLQVQPRTLHVPAPAGSTGGSEAGSRGALHQPLLSADAHFVEHPGMMAPAAPAVALLTAQPPSETAASAVMVTGQNPKYRSASGIVCAVIAGVFGGLILAPMDSVGRECRGVPYLAALAAGVAVATPLVAYCLHWAITGQVPWMLPMQPTAAALPGIAAGIVWAVGATSCMLAAASIGLAIAYPIMQAGMFIAALWGMLLYHELYSLKPHLVYWVGGLVLLGGILLLVNAGGSF